MQAIDEDIAHSYLREFMDKNAFVRLTFCRVLILFLKKV